MDVVVYSMPTCGICESAKEKLRIMKIPFRVADFDKSFDIHDGWRDDGAEELRAAAALNNDHPPIIRVDDKFYTYTAAMKILRGQKAPIKAGCTTCKGGKCECTPKEGG